ncbi:hypothetical protein [Aliikangiella maris]|uniref:Uncharacterized protein n=2 Tax=Aliikangiella maris TaxID=3162458 RepID=A0ABV3MIQ8_9GAMM
MFEQWLNSNFTHSLLLSPLMGIVFGALFAGLTKSADNQTPRTIIKTREVYKERVIYRNGNRSKSNNDDGGIVIAAGVGLLFIIWQYAVWAVEVHQYLSFTLFGVLSFCLTTTVISLFKGQFTSNEWWVYILFPLAFLSLSVYLLGEVKSRFDPELTPLAKEAGVYKFYFKSLSDYGRTFMITHVLGVACLTVLILTTTFVGVHYLSLMNQRTGGVMQGFWSFMVRATEVVSGRKGTVLSTFFGVLSFLLINEHIARWTSQ